MRSRAKMDKRGRTTISLSTDVYDRVCKYGVFGETFSDLIGRILDDYDRKVKKT